MMICPREFRDEAWHGAGVGKKGIRAAIFQRDEKRTKNLKRHDKKRRRDQRLNGRHLFLGSAMQMQMGCCRDANRLKANFKKSK